MQRRMLFFERFMYVDGVTPINCVITASLRGTIDAENLRAALRAIQARHPLLRARVVEAEGEPQFVMDAATPGIALSIVDRLTPEDWLAVTEAQWNVPFDAHSGPLLRVVWLRSPEVSELVFVAHHCICDGSSLLTLLREVLLVTDQPATVLPPYTSYASLDDLVPQEVRNDKKVRRRVRLKSRLFKVFLDLVARRSPVLPAGSPYVVARRLEARQALVIGARCKVEKTTPYAALCVAYLQAFREVQGNVARNKMMCPVDIRRLIPAIADDMMFAFAPTIALSLEKQPGADLWARARQTKLAIGEKIAEANVYEDLMVSDRMRSHIPKLLNFLRASRGGHDAAFSNLGRIRMQSSYSNFELVALQGASVAVPWRNTNTLVLSSFNDAMELNFISNERFLARQDAEAIQARAFGLLEEAMRHTTP